MEKQTKFEKEAFVAMIASGIAFFVASSIVRGMDGVVIGALLAGIVGKVVRLGMKRDAEESA